MEQDHAFHRVKAAACNCEPAVLSTRVNKLDSKVEDAPSYISWQQCECGRIHID